MTARLRRQRPEDNNERQPVHERVSGARTGRCKYAETIPEWPLELFDLRHDRWERRNVIGWRQHQAVLDDLRLRLHAFFEKAGAPPIEDWRSTARQKLPVYV